MKKKRPATKTSSKGTGTAALAEIREQNRRILELLAETVPGRSGTGASAASAASKHFRSTVTAGQADFLLKNPSFSRFTLEDAAILVGSCEERVIGPGEVIFKEGDVGTSLFIIKSGEVSIYKKDVLGDVEIARLGTGIIVGEMAIVDNNPRSANVKTATQTVLLEMSRDRYYTLLADFPGTGVKFMDILLGTLAGRLRDMNKKMFKLMSRF